MNICRFVASLIFGVALAGVCVVLLAIIFALTMSFFV